MRRPSAGLLNRSPSLTRRLCDKIVALPTSAQRQAPPKTRRRMPSSEAARRLRSGCDKVNTSRVRPESIPQHLRSRCPKAPLRIPTGRPHEDTSTAMARRQSSSRPANRHRERHGESSGRYKDRKRRSQAQRPGTSSDESRGSHSLSADALARLERENARQKRRAGRTKKAKGANYREVDQEPRRERARERTRDRERDRDEDRGRERPKDKDRKKKRRVVSGAVMEEGRAKSGLRGGQNNEWRWSDQSFEKEDYYHRPRPKKSRKKLCGYLPFYLPRSVTNMRLRDTSWGQSYHHHCHHRCGSGGEPKEEEVRRRLGLIKLGWTRSKRNSG